MTVNVPDNLCGLLVDTASVRPDPANYNRHSEAQVAQIAASIVAFGFDQPILARRNGLIIAGHGRWQAAKQLGMTQVPVVYTDLDGIDATRRMIGDNRLAALAEPHAETLAELLRQLQAEDALGGTGYDDVAVEALLKEVAGAMPPADDPGPQVDRAAELQAKWGTALGQAWTLGEHRLVCGDCTDPAVVAAVLAGATPKICVTDPPYGVEYDPAWRQEAAEHGHLAYAPGRIGEVLNDARVDWTDAWRLVPGDVMYCWHADRHASKVQGNLEDAGFEVRCQIIWSKSNFPISRGHYHWRHEPCWYAVRKGATAGWIGDRKQTTVWEINLDRNVEGGHGTQKPLECMERPIINHEGDVYEPFCGSGTTLIAAERQRRRCYAVELSPAYVAVTLQRWADMTGQMPRLLES